MKILVFSDIHGNLPAFELMFKDLGKVDLYVSLGDVVDYGPWSNECVELLDSLNGIKILGNHEEFFLKGDCEGANSLTKAFYDFCYKDFKEFQTLKSYKKVDKLGKYILSHTIDNQYIFPDSDISLDNNYIIGHSHYQFSIKKNGFLLLNPGSVGQNRQYINIINYMILDLDKDSFELKQIAYDVDLIINEMIKRKYPKACVDYYANKPRL